jgi:hypothetical protein
MITKNELKRFQSFMGFEKCDSSIDEDVSAEIQMLKEKKVEDKPKARHKTVSKKRTSKTKKKIVSNNRRTSSNRNGKTKNAR